MAEVTNDLIYEALKQVQRQMSSIVSKTQETNREAKALGMHLLATREDLQNISAILIRQDAQLERIERRLQIAGASA